MQMQPADGAVAASIFWVLKAPEAEVLRITVFIGGALYGESPYQHRRIERYLPEGLSISLLQSLEILDGPDIFRLLTTLDQIQNMRTFTHFIFLLRFRIINGTLAFNGVGIHHDLLQIIIKIPC